MFTTESWVDFTGLFRSHERQGFIHMWIWGSYTRHVKVLQLR